MESDYLVHYGIKGQEWGVRRFQNKDGSLTPEGKKRYSSYINDDGSYTEKAIKEGFERKVEKGVTNYIHGKKIHDPIVQEVIRRNKAEIDAQINAMNQRRLNDQWLIQQSIAGAEFAARESIRAANQAASLGLSGGMNPFMFG